MIRDDNKQDAMLIARARNGEDRAYETLVRKYQRRIYAFCFRMTGTHQSADDLAQETFIKAFFALPRFNPERAFFPWIRKIALNGTLNFLRSRRRELPMGDRAERIESAPGPGEKSGPEDRLKNQRFRIEFEKALESLPDDQRTVFVLRVYEDLNYRDIASLLKIPNGTVMSRLNRARRKLRQDLADFLEGGSR